MIQWRANKVVSLRVSRKKLAGRGATLYADASILGIQRGNWPIFIIVTDDKGEIRFGNRTIDGDTVNYNTPGYGTDLYVINDINDQEITGDV